MLAVSVNMAKNPVESEKRKPVRFFKLFKTMTIREYIIKYDDILSYNLFFPFEGVKLIKAHVFEIKTHEQIFIAHNENIDMGLPRLSVIYYSKHIP